MKQKKVLIIGSGIAGLRSALALALNSRNQIIIVEKSPSVGGRVATRRFGEFYVNHGTENFGGLDRVLKEDLLASKWVKEDCFSGRATELPKIMRDELLEKNVEFKFDWEVSEVGENKVESTKGQHLYFDQLIITAPVPQIEKITGQKIPGVQYEKCILFIGLKDGKTVRREMDTEWSEKMFDHSDLEIDGLSVKKWRYARVSQGLKTSFFELNHNIFLAGDAFDPEAQFNLGSSWLSGLKAGKEAQRRIHE